MTISIERGDPRPGGMTRSRLVYPTRFSRLSCRNREHLCSRSSGKRKYERKRRRPSSTVEQWFCNFPRSIQSTLTRKSSETAWLMGGRHRIRHPELPFARWRRCQHRGPPGPSAPVPAHLVLSSCGSPNLMAAARTEVRRIDRIEMKLMTWAEYVAGAPSVQKPANAPVDGPVWVCAVSGDIVSSFGASKRRAAPCAMGDLRDRRDDERGDLIWRDRHRALDGLVRSPSR